MLQFSEYTYGYRFGVDLQDFVSRIDPIKQFRAMRTICHDDILISRDDKLKIKHNFKTALIAAANLSKEFGRPCTTADLEPDPTMNVAKWTRRRSVYFSNKHGDLPIVIDTGASLSTTPCLDDFVGELKAPPIQGLCGLSHTTEVKGI